MSSIRAFSSPTHSHMADEPSNAAAPSRFRQTLFRVMGMQLFTLLLLALLQLRYNR